MAKRVSTLKEELMRVNPYATGYKEHFLVVVNFYRSDLYPQTYLKIFTNLKHENPNIKGSPLVDEYGKFKLEFNYERGYIIIHDLRAPGKKPLFWWAPKDVDHLVTLMLSAGFKLYWNYQKVKPFFPHWGSEYEKVRREQSFG